MHTQQSASSPMALPPAANLPEAVVRIPQAPAPVVILPEVGFVRLPQILALFPISRSAWWAGVKSGLYPKGIKISPRCTAWEVSAIRELLARYTRTQ